MKKSIITVLSMFVAACGAVAAVGSSTPLPEGCDYDRSVEGNNTAATCPGDRAVTLARCIHPDETICAATGCTAHPSVPNAWCCSGDVWPLDDKHKPLPYEEVCPSSTGGAGGTGGMGASSSSSSSASSSGIGM